MIFYKGWTIKYWVVDNEPCVAIYRGEVEQKFFYNETHDIALDRALEYINNYE